MRTISFSRRRLLLGGLAVGGLAACGEAATDARVVPATAADPRPVIEPAVSRSSASAVPGEAAIVTVLGDSITAGWGLDAAQALPVQLEHALNAAGVPARVRGAGVSGDTTAGGLARVDYSVRDDTDVVVVALGGNDLLQGVEPARMAANLDGILTRLKARGFTVVLAGMRGPPQFADYTAAYDRAFAELADRHDVYFYPFLLEGVALVARYNQQDGIHPNAEGARLIARGLAPVVSAAVRRQPVTTAAHAVAPAS